MFFVVVGTINNKTAGKSDSDNNIKTTTATMSNNKSNLEIKCSMSEEEFGPRVDAILAECCRQCNNKCNNPPRPIAAANPNIAMIPYEPDEIDDSGDFQ